MLLLHPLACRYAPYSPTMPAAGAFCHCLLLIASCLLLPAAGSLPLPVAHCLLLTSTRSWLIAIAYFLAGGFIKSGLGNRIAYAIVSTFGKTTLGLVYSLVSGMRLGRGA